MPDRSKRRRNQPQSTPEQDFIEALFRGIGQILKALFGSKGGAVSKSSRDTQFALIREHWQDVELHLLRPETAALAVSEADKLFDAAMLAMGAPGGSMGERLKGSEGWFTHDLYQRVWEAHKLRNSLAHEVGASVLQGEASQAASAFRDALYQLKVLR